MNLKPSHIKLNGNNVSMKDLLKEPPSDFSWENDFNDFIKEWYNDELFIQVQTSGSTGQPKTIHLKKDFVASSAKRTLAFFGLQENDKILHCLPSKFIAGKLMIVRAIIGNLDLHLVNPSNNFCFLEREDYAFAAMVPNQVINLLKLKHWNLKQLLIGGDTISSSLEKRLQIIDTVCYSSYGMTETATHIALRKLNGTDINEYYHCLPGISVQLSENNCLSIFVPGLEESPLLTSDIAKLKDQKFFKVLGRIDNVIISGGIKFSPEAIEKKLEADLNFPFMISSLPHDKLGKQLVLLIETKNNTNLRTQLERLFTDKLDSFEKPRQIIFVEELPRTSNEKLKRK